jgi:hypothetical protein
VRVGPAQELTENWVVEAGVRAAAARSGGQSALTSLVIGTELWGWRPAASIRAMARLGLTFPELERLSVNTLTDMNTHAAVALAPWAPLPRLRDLQIRDIGHFLSSKAVSTQQMTALLACIAAACPGLTKLVLKRSSEYISKAERSAGRKPSVLPSVGAALSGIGTLQCLTDLSLAGIEIFRSDIDGCDLPCLERLALHGCGDETAEVFKAIRRIAPLLKSVSSSRLGFGVGVAAMPLAADSDDEPAHGGRPGAESDS